MAVGEWRHISTVYPNQSTMLPCLYATHHTPNRAITRNVFALNMNERKIYQDEMCNSTENRNRINPNISHLLQFSRRKIKTFP